jgi:hypothetical protein
MNSAARNRLHRVILILGILFATLTPHDACKAQEPKGGGKANLLANANFEQALQGWDFSSWGKKGTVAVDPEVKRGETPSLRITNAAGDDSFCKQSVKVKVSTRYRLSGYIKTKDVVVKGGQAASLSLEGGFEATQSVKGTKSWSKFDFEFDSGSLDVVKVGCRLGGHSSPAMGTAWFDDLRLTELGPSRKR